MDENPGSVLDGTQHIKAAAATSGRSFNAELLERLRASFGEGVDVNARLDAISKQLARLERKVGK